MENGFLLIGHGADFSRCIAGCLNGGAEGVFVQRLLGVDYRLSLGMGGGDLLYGECGANGVVDLGLAHGAGHAGNFSCC